MSLIVFIGLILFVIPGLIFLAWYYYTIPAIMLKDIGATEGMSASKDFAKDKKFKTFLLYSTPFFLIFLLAIIFQDVYTMPALGWVVVFGIELFLFTWIAVVPAYAYIKYACMSVPQKEEQKTIYSGDLKREGMNYEKRK